MCLFYLRYPISQKPFHQLSRSHYVELLKLDDKLPLLILSAAHCRVTLTGCENYAFCY